MSRNLDDLRPIFKIKVFEFLARLTEAKVPVQIICTARTIEEQKEAVDGGFSWTMKSKHLPQAPDQKVLAIDICPYKTYDLYGKKELEWDPAAPVWKKVGEIGRSLGLKQGVVKNGKMKDLGHFEFVG